MSPGVLRGSRPPAVTNGPPIDKSLWVPRYWVQNARYNFRFPPVFAGAVSRDEPASWPREGAEAPARLAFAVRDCHPTGSAAPTAGSASTLGFEV